MTFPRASGILLHPTSLPGPHGIGSLGDEAYRFLDFLEECGQKLWQVLPLGPTGYADSPYALFSAFAGNHYIISLERVAGRGWLDRADLESAPPFPVERVDFGDVIPFKMKMLRRSYESFTSKASPADREEHDRFCVENADWLDDYALFMAIKEAHDMRPWNTWEPELARREASALHRCAGELRDDVAFHKYLQFVFFGQWGALKGEAVRRGISLIGDIPIFIAYDSADAWANPHLFHLDESGSPTIVAGVPPDYFSETGQLWGNPIYRWDVMSERGYDWWVRRFRATLSQVDIVRLDHFRGFEAYWAVPAGEETAVIGEWREGPGAGLFEAVERELGHLPIIAEDLGVITPGVVALRERFDLPGMRVLQFAFVHEFNPDFLPHNFIRNTVVYTGTHDNETTRGWFENLEPDLKKMVLRYTGTDGTDVVWDLIRLALSSVADTAVIPLQDVLDLGNEARMNHPSTTGENWQWRYTPGAITDRVKARLSEMTTVYQR